MEDWGSDGRWFGKEEVGRVHGGVTLLEGSGKGAESAMNGDPGGGKKWMEDSVGGCADESCGREKRFVADEMDREGEEAWCVGLCGWWFVVMAGAFSGELREEGRIEGSWATGKG